MKITFIGTGEVCDPRRRNTSVLVESDNHGHLLDCGFTAAQGVLSQEATIRTIWISHCHGDHTFGIPQLLVHFCHQQRTEPLTFLSGRDIQNHITTIINLAYPNLMTILGFRLHFVTIDDNDILDLHGLKWQTAKVNHSGEAFGLRLQSGAKSMYYSGDGEPTKDSTELLGNSDLVIHEAHLIQTPSPNRSNHCSIGQCQHMAKQYQPSIMALVHLSHETRQLVAHDMSAITNQGNTRVILPKDGEILFL